MKPSARIFKITLPGQRPFIWTALVPSVATGKRKAREIWPDALLVQHITPQSHQ